MSSEWFKEDELTLASALGVDPDVEWALSGEEGLDYLFPAEGLRWMPVVVEFKTGSSLSLDDFRDGTEIAGEQLEQWRKSVRALRLHTIEQHRDKPLRFCTALVTRDFFQLVWNLWKQGGTKSNYFQQVDRVTLGLPLEEDSLPPVENM